jgi:hypothetical protein
VAATAVVVVGVAVVVCVVVVVAVEWHEYCQAVCNPEVTCPSDIHV